MQWYLYLDYYWMSILWIPPVLLIFTFKRITNILCARKSLYPFYKGSVVPIHAFKVTVNWIDNMQWYTWFIPSWRFIFKCRIINYIEFFNIIFINSTIITLITMLLFMIIDKEILDQRWYCCSVYDRNIWSSACLPPCYIFLFFEEIFLNKASIFGWLPTMVLIFF